MAALYNINQSFFWGILKGVVFFTKKTTLLVQRLKSPISKLFSLIGARAEPATIPVNGKNKHRHKKAVVKKAQPVKGKQNI